MSKLSSEIKGTIDKKRAKTRAAVVILAISLIIAGFVVILEYGKPAETEKTKTVNVTLSATAHAVVAKGCEKAPNPMLGTVKDSDLANSIITLTLDEQYCAEGTRVFAIPSGSVVLMQVTDR